MKANLALGVLKFALPLSSGTSLVGIGKMSTLGGSEFWNVKATDVVIAGFTVVLAVVTAILACYTARLWKATQDLVRESGETARKELRAYVKMSHSPPGLTFETNNGVFRIAILVKNFGRTPARVTNALVKHLILPTTGATLPDIPDYGRDAATHQGLTAFLVAGDEAILSMAFSGVAPDTLRAVQHKLNKLWLYGYVAYIDQFGQRHRAGWARLYDPDRDDHQNYPSDEDYIKRSNLVFVEKEGYNYDRERMQHEGNDWEPVSRVSQITTARPKAK